MLFRSLPSDTFRQSAGTEVTSDILFLQKRERMADRDEPWLHVGKTGDGVPINQYFAEHPEMVLGDMVMESGPFGPVSYTHLDVYKRQKLTNANRSFPAAQNCAEPRQTS